MIQIGVSEPWAGMLHRGTKTVEGRLDSDKWSHVTVGSLFAVQSSDRPEFKLRVLSIEKFPTFRAYLNKHLHAALPGVTTVDDGITIYREFYPEEKEIKHGVIAFTVERIP